MKIIRIEEFRQMSSEDQERLVPDSNMRTSLLQTKPKYMFRAKVQFIDGVMHFVGPIEAIEIPAISPLDIDASSAWSEWKLSTSPSSWLRSGVEDDDADCAD